MIATVHHSPAQDRLVLLAAVATAVATALTFLVPDLLLGPAVMNGSAQGTALVMLVIGVPTLLAALAVEHRAPRAAVVVRVGVLAYLAYNDVMLLFATPFNRLFLLYVVAMSSTVFSLGATLVQADPSVIALRLRPRPARLIGGYILTIVVLNTLIWLRTILPATTAADPTSFLQGTGIATNPIFVQDLVFWLPSAAVIGWLTWTRRPWACCWRAPTSRTASSSRSASPPISGSARPPTRPRRWPPRARSSSSACWP